MRKDCMPAPDWEEVEDGITMARAKELGFGDWDRGGLMLFRAEWLTKIPAGMEIEDIMGRSKFWNPTECSNDRRMGFLAYGVRAIDYPAKG